MMHDDLSETHLSDDQFASIYEAAEQQDDEVLESICPCFVKLGECEERYTQESLIGRGGLKEVFRAYDNRSRRWVALARLRGDRGLQFYDLFVREAWLVASLSHPNIIKVHDTGVDSQDRPYFTMDLKGNTSLLGLIHAASPPSRTELLHIFLKVCDAVAYAHSRGVIHLDLKPENIQCDQFGEVLVCDWGLGTIVGDESADTEVLSSPSVENVTMLGEVKGSLGYMAPEQIKADGVKDARTDIYALGSILHTILCGEPPITGSMEEVFEKTLHGKVASLRSRFPKRQIAISMEAVVLKAVSFDPEKRYASVLQLSQEIQNFLGGYSTVAEHSGFFKEAHLFLRRHRISSAIALAALFALSTMSVLFIQRLGRQQMATEEERYRANRLMTEVSELSVEYELLAEESNVTRHELADHLARAARSLINLGVYHRPLDTEHEVRSLLAMALQLDEKSDMARRMSDYINCITLNYETAANESGRYTEYMELAHAFPHYHFTKDYRPTGQELVALFDYAHSASITPAAGYFERVLCYHSATLAVGSEGLDVPLTALLSYCNGGPDHFSMHYNPEMAAVEISTDQDQLFLRARRGKVGRSLLRFIPFLSLKVTCTGQMDLSEVSYLPLEVLDLSGCAQIRLNRGTKLPNLKVLKVPAGMFTAGVCNQWIESNEPIEVVEVF